MLKSKLMLRPDALGDLPNRVSLFTHSAKSRAQNQDIKRKRKVSCVILGPSEPPPGTGSAFLKVLNMAVKRWQRSFTVSGIHPLRVL